MLKNFKRWFCWVKKRLREKSTWYGIVIFAGTYFGKDMGWIKNTADWVGLIFFGGTLVSYSGDHDDDLPPPPGE